MTKNILSTIFTARAVAIFIHVNPDGDAVGSACAMRRALIDRGIEVDCYSEQPIPSNLINIDGADCFNLGGNKDYDLGLIVDASEISRIGVNCAKILKKCKKVALIDHHEEGSSAGIDYAVRVPEAASATQVIYYLLRDFDPTIISTPIAESLYAGVLTDSGGFQFASVTNKTMQMVAELYNYNINAPRIARQVMRDVRKNVFDLHTTALSNVRFFDNNSIGVVVLTQDMFAKTGTTDQDTMNIVTKVVDIIDVKLAISISEIGNNAYKVSTRSKGTDFALSLARCFGGGGHKEASGCRIYGYLDDCIEKLVSAARDVMADD